MIFKDMKAYQALFPSAFFMLAAGLAGLASFGI